MYACVYADPAHDSSSSDRLQSSWQAEDPPVPLSQLNHLTAHVLQTDTVSPLSKENTQKRFNTLSQG